MPLKKTSDYEDAGDYLDDTYRPEDNEDKEFNDLTVKEQENILKDMFFKATATPEQSAHDMRLGLGRPFGKKKRGNTVNLKGHVHHVTRDSLGRFKKWLD